MYPKMKETERAILVTAMFNAGIIPIEETPHDMTRVLSQLPIEDARKLKRKFRKVWRKLAKAEQLKQNQGKSKKVQIGSQYGKNKLNPSRRERLERKRLVQAHFYNDVVKPALAQASKTTLGTEG